MAQFPFPDGGTITVSDTHRTFRDRFLAWFELALSLSLTRHLFFAFATGMVVFLYGYQFGTYDQAIHIPSLLKFADPTLYPGDAFMDLRFQHYSFFWFLFIPFYKLGILEVTMFITHITVTYLTFWGLWSMSHALFHNRLAAVIAVMALVFPHAAFGGWTVFEFSLLNRTFVLPFLLFSIALYVKQRYLLAFVLLGLMYNLHALTANFVLAMFLLDMLLQWRKFGIRTIGLSVGVFALTALPVLVWKFSGPAESLRLDPEWLSLIARGMLSNTYFMFAPFPFLWLLTASGVGMVALYLLARRLTVQVRQNRTLTNFVIALSLLLLLQIFTVQWLPVTLLLQMQLIRAGVFLGILSYLCFAYYLALLFRSPLKSNIEPTLLALSLLIAFSFIPVMTWLVQRFCVWRGWRWGLSLVLIVMSFGVSLFTAAALNIWTPVVSIYPRETPWYDVQIWARNNTPREAVFITPPDIWSYHESDWRVFSERSTVATLTELMEVAFAPSYTSTWRTRFQAVAPGAAERFDGNTFENQKIVAHAFYSLSEQDILYAGCRYGASYLVTEKPHTHSFRMVYENEKFMVFALPQDACSFQTPTQ